VWWCTPVIPALRRLRQEDWEFQTSLDKVVRRLRREGEQEEGRKEGVEQNSLPQMQT
jgi:hypothetical protein